MPDSVGAILVLVFAMFPGFIGNRVFESFVGLDWREREWRTVLRLIGLSAAGAALYSLLADRLGWSPPVHLFPSTFRDLTPESPMVGALAASYVGHLFGSAIAGGVAIAAAKALAMLSSVSVYPGAWDDLARTYAPNHWVAVGLTSGQVYAGKLKNADVAVAAEDRDLVMEEPCAYDPLTGEYVAIGYQHLFVPASTWFSIAVIHDGQRDRRTVAIGQPLFVSNGERNEREVHPSASAARTQA